MNDNCGCNDYSDGKIFIFTRKLSNFSLTTFLYDVRQSILLDLKKCKQDCSPKCGIIRNIQTYASRNDGASDVLSLRLMSNNEYITNGLVDLDRVIFEDLQAIPTSTFNNMSVFIPFILQECEKMYFNICGTTGNCTVNMWIRISGVII